MNFRLPTQKERDDIILSLLTGKYSTTEQGKDRWIKGWQENLDDFNVTNDVNALLPKWIKPNMPIRYFGDFIFPEDDEYHRKFYEKIRAEFFEEWFCDFEHIFEFGSGSGYNLAALKKTFPSSNIHGLDWVQPSIDIANMLECTGHIFDFFTPDYSLNIPANSIFLTIGGLEQTGKKWAKFLQFMLDKKPARICHLEPIYEFYDPTSLVDYTAMQLHERRGFCMGYLPALENLEQEGHIRILQKQRTNIGNKTLEGYSKIVWELA